MIAKIRSGLEGVVFEMRKVSWPTWEELKGSTLVVFVLSGILAFFLFTVDSVLSRIVALFIQ